MVVDRNAPLFVDKRDYRIVPAECVHGVIEVKSFLDGRELQGACNKIKSVKALPKTAYAPPADGKTPRRALFYGRSYDHTPTTGLIIAFDSINIEELAKQFAHWCSSKDLALLPDGVWVLGKGQLLWSRPDGDFLPRPDLDSELVARSADPDRGNLLYLAVQLGILFSYVWMPPFSLQRYARLTDEGTEIARFAPRHA